MRQSSAQTIRSEHSAKSVPPADAVAVDLGDHRLGRAPQRHVGVDEAAHDRVVGHRVPRAGPPRRSPSPPRPSRCRSRRRTRGRRRAGGPRARPRRPGRGAARRRRSLDELGGDRVAALGPVQRERGDRIRRLVADRAGHAAKPTPPTWPYPLGNGALRRSRGPGCAATAAGRPTSRCRCTTRASTRSTRRRASAPRSSTSCRRPSCSAWTACTTSPTSASATAASSRSRTAGSG